MTYKEIAEKLGVKRHNVVYFLKKEGLEGTKKVIPLTKEEIQYFKDEYANKGTSYFAKKFGVTKSGIGYYARTFGVVNNIETPRLTDTQKKYIRKNYKKYTYQEIADEIGCTKAQVTNLIVNDGKTGYLEWNEGNINHLKRNYIKMTDKQLAKETHRTEAAILAKRIELNLLKESDKLIHPNIEVSTYKSKTRKIKPRVWTTGEENFVKSNYQAMSDMQMGQELKRTAKSVKHKRLSYKLFRNNSISNHEVEIESYLESLGVDYEAQFPLGPYLYDFKIGETLMEFNGDYWHCNPEVYPNGPINRFQAYAIKKDSEKIKLAKNNGYDVYTIWEFDYLKNKDKTLEKAMAVLSK